MLHAAFYQWLLWSTACPSMFARPFCPSMHPPHRWWKLPSESLPESTPMLHVQKRIQFWYKHIHIHEATKYQRASLRTEQEATNVAPGHTARNKKLLEAPGHTTSSKDATIVNPTSSPLPRRRDQQPTVGRDLAPASCSKH